MRPSSSWLLGSVVVAALVAASLVGPSGSLRAEDSKTAEPTRYQLSPSFSKGDQFRVERTFQQTTITTSASRRGNDFNASAYDAGTQLTATVTVDEVDAKGAATEWTAKFERLRVDIPDPIQTADYRLRMRERKQKRLAPNAHPLEGATVKVKQTGDKAAKARLFKVLKSGEDAGISQRYPEITPIMQSLVDPDWASAEAVTVGTEWEMAADQIFRMTKVLAKAPLEGKIRCKLASVTDGVATIEWSTTLSETYATAEMKLSAGGQIEFDVTKRRTIGNRFKGEVEISAKGSSLAGRGTIAGGSSFTDPNAGDDSDK